MKAGDLVLGDARMLHAAHPNSSGKRRTLITMWYLPEYAKMPANMKERIGNLHIHQVGHVGQGTAGSGVRRTHYPWQTRAWRSLAWATRALSRAYL